MPTQTDQKKKKPGNGKKTLAVETNQLTKSFNLQWRRGNLLALESLDLAVTQGEVFGLLGPNGSGKSTTMKLLLGLLNPTQGEAFIFGHRAGSMEAKRSIGFLPENPYFPSFLSGPEVLKYYGQLSGMRGRVLQERIEELIQLVGLKKAEHRPLRTYSKGMLQRIGLAQALLHDPDLLLLDEPTAGVDPMGSRQIRDLILELKERGKTVIFSSHLLEQVQEVSDRVAILHLGQKLQEGTLEELLTAKSRIEIEMEGMEGIDEALEEKIRKLLKENGVSEAKVKRPQIRLEDFFIQVLKNRD